MEAMLRLLWHSFAKWMFQKEKESQESITVVDENRITSYYHTCQEAVIGKSKEALHGQFHLLCTEMKELLNLLDMFRREGRQKSKLFAFWDSYIEMVELLLTFIRAEREGNWTMHLAATMEMTPHFFSMDRVNYSRWLPVYLADMDQLAVSLHLKFIKNSARIAMQLTEVPIHSVRCGQSWRWNKASSLTAKAVVALLVLHRTLVLWLDGFLLFMKGRRSQQQPKSCVE